MSEQYDTALMYYEKAVEYAGADEIVRVYRLIADTYDDMEEDVEMRDLFNDFILDNIKSIYDEFVHDGTSYETWFRENFEDRTGEDRF